VVGRGSYIGPGVIIGDKVKIQNAALIYDPAVLGHGVFIGPGAILTNDVYPRSTTPCGAVKGASEWVAEGVTVGDGASVGAHAVVLAGVTVGPWAMVGAGAVVIRDVPAYAVVVGNPAERVGWVGRSGRRLVSVGPSVWRCPESDESYREIDTGSLVLLEGSD